MTKTIETTLMWYKCKDKMPEKDVMCLLMIENIPYGNIVISLVYQKGLGFAESMFSAFPENLIKYWAYLPELT